MNRSGAGHALNDTRLVRLLTGLGVTQVKTRSGGFAERLGAVIDFGDSMRLAAFHDELRKRDFEPGPGVAVQLREELLQERLALVQGVLQSFVPGAGKVRPKLPSFAADAGEDSLPTFEPYHRFYAAHQREFESRIQALQLRVREGAGGQSRELGQLVALDEAMRDICAVQTRKSLALIPKLLGRRFEALLQAHHPAQQASPQETAEQPLQADLLQASAQPAEWLQGFLAEMRELLLAELELRLMPVVGLVEALEVEVEGKT